MTTDDVVAALRAAGCVFAEDEARLLMSNASTDAELARLVARRVSGVPLEHVLGWAEFAGLRITVDPGIFVPRRRTEFLVHSAAERARPGAIVVDLCCGCGALGVALASVVDGVELHAADVDPAAVRCARRNVEPIGGHTYEGDLFGALPDKLRGRIDILLANVPYVPTEEIAMMSPEAREYEARVALDGGTDGLDVLRRVALAAPSWLADDGSLFVETSSHQAETAVDLMIVSGLTAHVVESDDDEATVVIGTNIP